MTSQMTLVAFETKRGATAEYASILGGVLHGDFDHHVDMVNLREQKVPDLAPYDNVIVGSGIRIQRVYGKFRKLLKDKRLAEKRVAIFLSSGEAGGDPYKATKKYIGRIEKKYPHLNPVAAQAFGGVYPNGKSDFREPETMRKWAHELGEKLKK